MCVCAQRRLRDSVRNRHAYSECASDNSTFVSVAKQSSCSRTTRTKPSTMVAICGGVYIYNSIFPNLWLDL